jgi:hypothetical protein
LGPTDLVSDTALVQAADLKRVGTPTKRELNFLRVWLMRPMMGNLFLNDREQTIWDESNTSDLLTLLPHDEEKDAFTSLLNGFLLDIYHRVVGDKSQVCFLRFDR